MGNSFMSKTCIICQREIAKENDSVEHIIPQAIGGRLSVRGFLCKKCNAWTGEKWDSVLTKQLNPLSLFFTIVRKRGTAPPQLFTTSAGERLIRNIDGDFSLEKPHYHEVAMGNRKEIRISARTDEELEKILQGLKKKYPQINLDALKKQVIHVQEYPKGAVLYNLQLGGEMAGKSTVKTALSFAYSQGIDMAGCACAVEYLRGIGEPPFGLYSNDIVRNRLVGVPFHCVSILGNSNEGLLLAYVEYYGFFRIVVCLSDHYSGETFAKTHAINPMTGKRQEITVDFPLKKDDIKKLYNGEMILDEQWRKNISDVIGPRIQAEQDKVLKEIISLAIKKSGCREGETISKEHAYEISREIAENIVRRFVGRI
jgi:HNH endonuclease